jgi:hypothetical protein
LFFGLSSDGLAQAGRNSSSKSKSLFGGVLIMLSNPVAMPARVSFIKKGRKNGVAIQGLQARLSTHMASKIPALNNFLF